MLHYGYAFAHVVRAVATNFGFLSVRVGESLYYFELACGVVVFGLHVGEAVYAGDYHSRVFAETVEDYLKRLFAHFVCGFGNADCAFGGGKALVTREEAEAFGFLVEQHGSEVAVSETHRALFGNRAGHAERLQAFADCNRGFGGFLATFLNRDCTAHGVSPGCVFERYHLRGFNDFLHVYALVEANFASVFEVFNSVCLESFVYFLYSLVISFKSDTHGFLPPYCFLGSMYCAAPSNLPYVPVEDLRASFASIPPRIFSIITPSFTNS